VFRKSFKKHVLTYWVTARDFEKVVCPLGENEFRDELKSKDSYAVVGDDE
jgi:hypothetical protein